MNCTEYVAVAVLNSTILYILWLTMVLAILLATTRNHQESGSTFLPILTLYRLCLILPSSHPLPVSIIVTHSPVNLSHQPVHLFLPAFTSPLSLSLSILTALPAQDWHLTADKLTH
jgi:ABC-type Co2+ transport system permease subunit